MSTFDIHLWSKYSLLTMSLLDSSDLLLWDEPSNYIDVRTIQMLIDFVKIQSKTVLIVDHNADFLNTLSDHVISLQPVSLNQ